MSPPYKQLGIKSNQEKRQEPSLQITGDKVEPGKKTRALLTNNWG
jgi:hypothetical protein